MRYQYSSCGLGQYSDQVMYATAPGATPGAAPIGPPPVVVVTPPPAQTGGFWVPLLLLGGGVYAVSRMIAKK